MKTKISPIIPSDNYGIYYIFVQSFKCNLVPFHNFDRVKFISIITGTPILRKSSCDEKPDGFGVLRNSKEKPNL